MPRSPENRWATLALQMLVLAACVWALWLFGTNFPYPSPLIKPFLPPHKRWPTVQVSDWVKSGHVNAGFLDFFMRDPDRHVPPGTNVVAPADGELRNIIHTPDWTYVDIALSYWDVHVQRSPVAGTVVSVKSGGDRYMDGEYKHQIYLREHGAPVQKIVTLSSAWGNVKIRLVTSLNARRIRVWVQPGEHLKKGQRIGRILLGSTVILQLPPEMALDVRKGQRVVAGETIVSREAPE